VASARIRAIGDLVICEALLRGWQVAARGFDRLLGPLRLLSSTPSGMLYSMPSSIRLGA
jgi:hypothetical protein